MTGNWLIMEMNGLGQIGILYPQFKKSAKWLQQALESLEEELDRQIYPDGFQYELTTNYHDVVINNYQRFIEVAYKFGKTIPDTLLEKLSRACELDIKLMMPDGKTPDLNDGCRRDVKGSYEVRKRIIPMIREQNGLQKVMRQESQNIPQQLCHGQALLHFVPVGDRMIPGH